jgi:hypothetical protein
MKIRMASAAIIVLMAGNVTSFAQDPPGAREQDRSIREDLGRPGTVGQGPRERAVVPVVPAPSERRGPEGRYYGEPLEPPGGDWQDKATNEDAGKAPGGDKR